MLGGLLLGACYQAQVPETDPGSFDAGPPIQDGSGAPFATCHPTSFDSVQFELGPAALDVTVSAMGTNPAMVLSNDASLATFDAPNGGLAPVGLGTGWTHPRITATADEAYVVFASASSLHRIVLVSSQWTDMGMVATESQTPEGFSDNGDAFVHDNLTSSYSLFHFSHGALGAIGPGRELKNPPTEGVLRSANITADGNGVVYVIDNATQPANDGVYFTSRNEATGEWPDLPDPPKNQISSKFLTSAALSSDCKTLTGVALSGQVATLHIPP